MDSNSIIDKKYSWREKKIIQWMKPPDPVLNVNKKKLKRLITDFSSTPNRRILDIGSGGRKFDNKIINFDIENYNDVNIIGDAHNLPFCNDSFNLIIITAVLEHVKNPVKVIEEIKRCLKSDGIVYAEVPFLQGFHADPHDYQRFTKAGLKILFGEFKEHEVGVCGGPISVLTWYIRKLPVIYFTNIYIIKLIEFITGWAVFILKYFDYLTVHAKNAHILASALYYIGSKR
ncbi:class I SAM-dependent methyltransferase [candidate division KSB1 bacterium]|nr:class I SAM-dependent methyltransferase [candidate division KSB1 bacterium]